MGGFSTLRLSWEQIKQKLENEGAKNKAYDSDVDGVFDTGAIPDLDASKITSGVLDLARIPTITRDKLEYPTEDVNFAYLTAIGKAKHSEPQDVHFYPTCVTVDSFTDKAIAFIGIGVRTTAHLRVSGNDYYDCRKDTGRSTSDFVIDKYVGGSGAILATESVDLDYDNAELIVFSVSGSTLKAWRNVKIADVPNTSATLSATDTDIASGQIGASHGWDGSGQGTAGLETHIYAPFSRLSKPLTIVEVDELKQNLVPISQVDNVPDFLKANVKKYEILKARGFTDEEIKLLLGDIQTHVDLASVTWGTFDHKLEHNTMLITITAGNPYTGEKAITEQIEHAKSKNLKVLKPPRDYSEAIEQYKQLKQEFTEWIAGKDNFAYQTLGHEDFEKFQVADTYHGNIVEGYRPNAYKNVPDWEIRRTLAMWKERLKRATVVKTEAEKHLKKLEEVEKKGW